MIDASYASFQARLHSFDGTAAATKNRRNSKTKKAPAKSKNAWPLTTPSAHDLAYAGFVWRPTTASPDNVQCFHCNCQLDGWEASDVPAYEHLTHSPNCGFAIVTCIRLRDGDPGRSEEDPSSDSMVQARRATFGDMWPLDPNAGYPSVDQMASAGWYYDPMEDAPDGVTCPYCSLSLDAWDAGDDPTEEHRRRSGTCLFFALTELYNKPPAPKKGKRASTASAKGKRASSRSSIASTTGQKATRGKKRDSSAVEDSELSEVVQPAAKKKATRGRKRASDAVDEPDFSEIIQPTAKKTTRRKKRGSDAGEVSTISESIPAAPITTAKRAVRGKKQDSDTTDVSTFSEVLASAAAPTKKNTRGKGRGSTTVTDTAFSFVPPVVKKPTRGKTRASNVEEAERSEALSQSIKDKERVSTSLEESESIEASRPSPKRMRSFSMSSLPDDLPVGTPKKTPSGMKEPAFTTSSFPANLPAGTPKKTPSGLKESIFTMSSLPADLPVGTPKRTPPGLNNSAWQPTDLDAFFADNSIEVCGVLQDIVVDAGLDHIAGDGSAPAIHAAVSAGLTDAEKAMTVEEWVLYNAKRGSEKLRMACEKQISAFEEEGKRALTALESIPVC